MNKSIVAVLLASAVSISALAQNTPNVDKREANQQKRIDQGVQSGQLTNKEAARLEKGQAKVDKIEAKAKADGVVTAKERNRLHKAQDHQSKKIPRFLRPRDFLKFVKFHQLLS